MKRSKTSKSWMNEHVSDPYVHKAKIAGYRSRAAFKLLEANEKFNFLTKKMNVVDLGSAPGSWSQVLSEKLYENDEQRNDPNDVRIASVDLQEVAPIPGVSLVMGDITTKKTAQEVLDIFKGEKADLVISDGAPDVTGFHEIDQYMQAQLL